MQKIFFLLFLLPGLLIAQYYGERATEQNFETSELYFTSHYLNTFALQNFKNAAAGLMNDPFMNLYINPASLPARDSSALLYMDFRGDRTETPIAESYVMPAVYYTADFIRPYPDPRWITLARKEPEPVVSAGILAYPFGGIFKNVFFGATYQFIFRQEKYYEMPYWIYNSRLMYDSFGAKAELSRDVPVIDRENGSDKMLTKGSLFSAFAGVRISGNLSLGLSVNGVVHNRKGDYANINNSEYGNTSEYKYSNLFGQARNNDYNHLDYSAGLQYSVNDKLTLGANAGILNGKADQDFTKESRYSYVYKTSGTGPEWSNSFSDSRQSQLWKQDGKTKHFGVNFNYHYSENIHVSGFYRYSRSDINLINSSVIIDTSYYSYKWASVYTGNSGASDVRTGKGSRNYTVNEAMLSVFWQLSRRSNITVGLYANNTGKKNMSTEPAAVRRMSSYVYNAGNPNQNYFNSVNEIKTLEWTHEANSFTVQIPVILNLQASDAISIMLALNRILNNWDITESTTAYFDVRQRTEGGETNTERNFGERYIQPSQLITENNTAFAAGVNVSISPQFQVNLLMDPEFSHGFMLAQWWIGFRAKLY